LSTLNVLAYVPTFNSAEVIGATMESLCRQTYPVAEILLIDNASSDATLERDFPDKVTILKNVQNLGTSGAAAEAMRYGLSHGYDWIYVLDADSNPEPTAVEYLVKCYMKLGRELQVKTWRLNSLPKDANAGFLQHGCVFTRRGVKMLNPPPQPSRYECHASIWSGSFYRLDAVKKVGLPHPNYVIDWDDVIYGYEGMLCGFIGFVEQLSIVLHHMNSFEISHLRRLRTRSIKVFYLPPFRSYYFWRNSFYFWIYKYRRGHSVAPIASHLLWFCGSLCKVALLVKNPRVILQACIRGMWDGVHGRLQNRYENFRFENGKSASG
jgi:GT2 family glycosyltransferase